MSYKYAHLGKQLYILIVPIECTRKVCLTQAYLPYVQFDYEDLDLYFCSVVCGKYNFHRYMYIFSNLFFINITFSVYFLPGTMIFVNQINIALSIHEIIDLAQVFVFPS